MVTLIIPILLVNAVIVIDVLMPRMLLFGATAIAPCLAAVSAGPRAVAAVGGYALTTATVVSSIHGLAFTPNQLVRLMVIVGVTALSMAMAHRRQLLERRARRGAQSQALLASVVETSGDAVMVSSLDGVITAWNAAAEQMYGYCQADAIGRHVSMIIPPERLPNLADVLERVRAGKRVWRVETQRIRRDGTLIDVSVTVSPVHEPDGKVVAVSAIERDVTAEKEAERQRQSMRERSARAERLESLGHLAGGVAHDFNNLLAIILNYAEFVAERVSDDQARDDLSRISAAADQARQLTGQLLLFARSEPARTDEIDLNEVVTDARNLLARSLGEHIELVSRPADEALVVLANRGRVDQILLNLVVNARDAMPDGGKLTIEARPVELAAELVEATTTLPPGRYAQLRVIDTGTGMSPEVVERIFEPFFTTKAKDHGTGLGMATVYGVVTEAGGSIKVYSEVGVGTTMRILLPLAERASDTDDIARETPEPGHGERILVVEDDDGVRQLAAQMLERNGYTAVTASRAGAALELLARQPCDLVLTDVIMPETSGIELADRLRRLHPRLPVLFMTGYAEEHLNMERIHDHGHPLIVKPFTTAELLHGIQHALTAATTAQPHERSSAVCQ
ncbi:PAS domain S-box protein [Actinoplanes sp. NPDC051346]|uniref:hybrid sensor histidine kinase/response regulator n=1 Tax=Actinoplanes sp. NPDC051346 TaxID=3155048 RepID=UPI00342A88D4